MTRIVIDPSFQSQLQGQKHVLEICDPAGKVLGHFLPVIVAGEGNDRAPQISEEEIQHRVQNGGGRPLADILADLEKRS